MRTIFDLLLLGATTGLIGWLAAKGKFSGWFRQNRASSPAPLKIAELLRRHFAGLGLEQLAIAERKFPYRVRVDLQQAAETLFAADGESSYFCGVHKEYSHETLTFRSLFVDGQFPAVACPPEYEEIDVGDPSPRRCLKTGLWLLQRDGVRIAAICTSSSQHGVETGVQIQIAAPRDEASIEAVRRAFAAMEAAVAEAGSYRGKVLSLEQEQSYFGHARGVLVHRLRTVQAEELILPAATLQLLQRNVQHFVEQRPRLAKLGQATKKGLLFYGPPGTGKTHTIHYLAGSLPGHTTLLITADQVGLLGEYMALARLLQPSVVVMEDVDLVARDRNEMGVCEEILLNKLLNEMDGLKAQADVLFILTTNRPQAIEAALAARPGRIDQAIEFPLPDDLGRARLARLYAGTAPTSDRLIEGIVQKTEGVSAAFIKELMRRSTQFSLERCDGASLEICDVDSALDEMLFRGGSLNAELLGAASRVGGS
jgi:hypothetical protein